jgi:hypothetical protein
MRADLFPFPTVAENFHIFSYRGPGMDVVAEYDKSTIDRQKLCSGGKYNNLWEKIKI